MLVLLSDPALPRKAPRGGGGSGRAASLRARPRRPAGTPGHRANRAGGSSALRGQGQTVGGLRVRAERGRNISGGSGTPLPGPPHRCAGAGPRPPRRSPSGPRPWGRRAALPRRRREAAGPAAAARNRALGAAFRRGAARGRARLSARSGALQRAAALAADGTSPLQGDTRRRGSAEPATCRFLPGSVKHTPLRTDSECKEPCLFKRDAAFFKSNSTMYVANRVGKQLTYGCCA